MTAPEILRHALLAAAEGTLVVCGMAVVCRALPRFPATARATLCWLAAARFLTGLAPRVTIPLAPAAAATADHARAVAHSLGPAAATVVQLATRPALENGGAALINVVSLSVLLCWVAGALPGCVRAVVARRRLRAQWRNATTLAADDLVRLGIESEDFAAAIRSSADIEVPLTFGWLHPRVLVPESTVREGGVPARLALEHELAHVRRRDVLRGVVPALAQTLFWWNPAAAWCAREYAQACEEACDAEVLHRTGAPPHAYAELLLRFGVARVVPPGVAASCGSRTGRSLSRRFHMLERFALPSRRARVAAMAVVVLAVAVLLPVRVIAGRDSKGTLQTTAAMPLVTSTGADRSDFSYLFVDHDSNRTHGMLDTRDLSVLQRARRSVDRDFLLLRLKDRFYTVTEPQALADAAALVSQLDAYQARLAPIEAHMEVLGTQSIDGTAQLNDATVRYDELDGRVQTLRTAVAQRRARGLDVTALAAQLAAAREARDAAAALTQERERQVEELSAQQEAEQKRIDALTAELDRAHEGVLADLRAWATSAIARGVARPLG